MTVPEPTTRPSPEPTPGALPADALGSEPAGVRRGTARAALQHHDFRVMWLGSFGSNIGSWMQQVVLGSYAFQLTGSAAFVGLLGFAQLGPLLLLSLVGGLIADAVDRRRLLIGLQVAQLGFSLLLAWIVHAYERPAPWWLFACVLAIGTANALNAPAWSAVLPAMVGREDLPGAISLNSTMINGSRVVGPALAGVLYPLLGPAWIFALNGATYLLIIAALAVVRFPAMPRAEEKGLARLAVGFRVARRTPVVGRILLVMPLFSFFCLPFVGLFAAIAETSLGMDTKSLEYGLLYASFGLGAATGSLSIGTAFSQVDKGRLARGGLVAFAVFLFTFGVLRTWWAAYPVVFLLGAVYFGTTTSMLTVLQAHVADEVRGRVMALWFMGFGGTVSLAALAFGPLLDATNTTVVLSIGAAVALALAWWADLPRLAARHPGTA